jgi:hypothetical protein
MRAKTINFNREGTPYEKLGIGRHGIKRALLNNPTVLDSPQADGLRDWINNLPEEIQEVLNYDPIDPLAFTDYLGFDEDYYLENEAPEVDYDEFHADFSPTQSKKSATRNIDKSMHRTSVQYQIGKLPDGSKVMHYSDGMGSGYIAHKKWLN